jgi:hypothetical protein
MTIMQKPIVCLGILVAEVVGRPMHAVSEPGRLAAAAAAPWCLDGRWGASKVDKGTFEWIITGLLVIAALLLILT